jgi:hypothetical protein
MTNPKPHWIDELRQRLTKAAAKIRKRSRGRRVIRHGQRNDGAQQSGKSAGGS